jgi:asparagine synthase (glutamine-hydrolysing)
MCGIAGVIEKSDYSTVDLRACIATMNHTMAHRGPDDEGCFVSVDQRVGMGNRRLAIRDLSPAGHMPMSDETESVWITYNGEIYNAEPLRNELEALGYQFRSTSDTEVILKGYMQWGKSIVAKLRGMFAFAIYDSQQNQTHPQIFLARDHLGVKPLYYAETTSHFIFASELKVILASGLVSKEVSPDGLMGYLLTGSVPNPLTIYRDIKALEPAHLMQVNLSTGQVEREAYWQLPQIGRASCRERV